MQLLFTGASSCWTATSTTTTTQPHLGQEASSSSYKNKNIDLFFIIFNSQLDRSVEKIVSFVYGNWYCLWIDAYMDRGMPLDWIVLISVSIECNCLWIGISYRLVLSVYWYCLWVGLVLSMAWYCLWISMDWYCIWIGIAYELMLLVLWIGIVYGFVIPMDWYFLLIGIAHVCGVGSRHQF